MRAPLDGIRVLDLGTMVAAPYGATMLGDMGADVIKVEPPQGDELRHVGPGLGTDSGLFVGVNRNKRSLVLDLLDTTGQALFQRLVATADVVIHNIRASACARLGLRHEDLRQHRADVISVRVSTYGDTGPMAQRPGIDPSAQAMSGFMSFTGFADGEPLRSSIPIADATAANLIAFGVVTALFARQRDGAGQALSVALIDGMVHLQPGPVGQFGLLGYAQPRVGNSSPFLAPYNTYRCRDGQVIHVAVINDKYFARLCEALECPGLIDDPRFASNAGRLEHVHALDGLIGAAMQRFDGDEAMARLQRADAIAAPVRDMAGVFADPQLAASGMLVPVEHSRHGPIRVGGVATRLSRTPGSVRRAPPALGEHTGEILESLGASTEQIARFTGTG